MGEEKDTKLKISNSAEDLESSDSKLENEGFQDGGDRESIKVLNLYAGIGGNRKLWDKVVDVEVTAVEIKPEIADIYQDFFPNDKVVVADATEYFEKNFHKFDFVWASPPCKTHSRINRFNVARRYNGEENIKVKIPDFRLYSMINFLDTYFKGDWVVENTYSDYEPLKIPQLVGRHYIWSNKNISQTSEKFGQFHSVDNHKSLKELCKFYGLNYNYFKDIELEGIDLKQILRNCVHPKLGKHILKSAFKDKQQTLEMIPDD